MKLKDAAAAALASFTESMWAFDNIDVIARKGARVRM